MVQKMFLRGVVGLLLCFGGIAEGWAQNSVGRFVVNTGASVVVAYGVKTVLKTTINEERPDHSDNSRSHRGMLLSLLLLHAR